MIFSESVNKVDLQFQLTAKYTKTEFIAALLSVLGSSLSPVIVISSNLFFQVNSYRLPFSFYITLLPFHEISFNWFLNYLYQAAFAIFVSLYFFIYYAISLVFINNACLGVDVSRVLVAKLNETLNGDPSKFTIDELIKEIVEYTNRTLLWQKQVQNLMQLNFLVEFSVQSFVICTCIFNLSTGKSGSSIYMFCVVTITLTQLYVYCWMGNRLITRIDSLTAAIYNTNWYLMDVKQQKNLQLIILRAQQMKTFDGIFNTLDLHTFEKVR